VATHLVRTAKAPVALRVSVDKAGIPLAFDGVDAVFVHAQIVDENGTVVVDTNSPVTFTVDGPARIVGGQSVCAIAGIASVLLQAGLDAGPITITASAPELGSSSYSLVPAPEETVHERGNKLHSIALPGPSQSISSYSHTNRGSQL
jgi:beta-galactosidase